MGSSPLYGNEFVIDDSTPERDWHPSTLGFGSGWEKPECAGYGSTVGPFPEWMLIPRSEWQARIQELQDRGMLNSQRIRRAGMKSLNQEQTNFCFANAPTNLVRVNRLKSNEPYVELSAASLACRVTNFRNQGGFAGDVVDIMGTEGIMPTEYWPTNAISRKYDTPANWEKAKPFVVNKWWKCDPGNLDQWFSMLLRLISTADAHNWWGHEVMGCDPMWLDGGPAARKWNSWGDGYGDKGMFILQGNRMLPDDCIAIWS